jgi:hypothetical protein
MPTVGPTDTAAASPAVRFAIEAVADVVGAERVVIRHSPGGNVWNMVEDDLEGLLGQLSQLGIATSTCSPLRTRRC